MFSERVYTFVKQGGWHFIAKLWSTSQLMSRWLMRTFSSQPCFLELLLSLFMDLIMILRYSGIVPGLYWNQGQKKDTKAIWDGRKMA